jgi:RNA-binding protein
MLTSKQRQFLKARAHELKPVIQVGHKGVTEALVKETQGALLAHELIKAKLPEGEGAAVAEELATGAGAELVAVLGRVAVLYAPHPETPKIRLPKEKSKPWEGDD